MAVINKETKINIAKKLCEKKYGRVLKEYNAKLSKMIEEELIKSTPEPILICFGQFPNYFNRVTEISLSFNDLKSFLKFPDIKIGDYTYFRFKFSKRIPIYANGNCKELYLRAFKFGTSEFKELLTKYLKLHQENSETEKKLTCLFKNTVFTEKKLMNEFPEAYSVYCEIKDIPKEVATSNSCDSIENIRATLNKK